MEKSTWSCCTLSCFLMLWAPRWRWLSCTENRVEVWGAWSHRRYSPRAVTGRQLKGRATTEGKLRWQTALGKRHCVLCFSMTWVQGFWELSQEYCEINVSLHEELIELQNPHALGHNTCRISENVLWLHKWPPISFWLRSLGLQVTGVGGGHCHRQWSS